MIDIDRLYGEAFFRGRNRYHWRAPIVCAGILNALDHVHTMAPKDTVDLGCATGDLVQGFLDLGLEAWGVEGGRGAEKFLACPSYRVNFCDLREPLPAGVLPDKLSFLTCFEVAEHLEPEFADQFVETLTGLSDHLITSACPPHPTKKPTKYHYNEAPPEYWDEKFEARGFVRDGKVEKFLLGVWYPWRKKYGIAAYWQNLLCYRRSA